jgi:molybdopterin adenylyltransferase
VEAIVRAIFIKPEKGSASMPLRSVNAVVGGLEGDHHTGSSRQRHILLLSAKVLDELNLQPGTIYENVLIDGIDVMALQEGQEFYLGEALVAVTIPCEPCIQMERVRSGLREVLQNRRGMFVKVLVPGTVRVGDRLITR